MKKKLLMSLIILGSATTLISYPIKSHAAEETTEAAEAESIEDTGEESTSKDSPPEGESSENGEEVDSEAPEVEETTAPEPEISYYVIVTNEEGAKLYQEASQDSSLSINIPIPYNTVLHIVSEFTDDSGNVWGFTNYADLKEGYIQLSDMSTIKTQTAKEFVEDKLDGNWGKDFVKVDGSGTPISFNALSQEDLDKAEESNAAAANKKTTIAESTEVAETDENGSPVIDVTMQTDEDGNHYPMQTDEEGNLVPLETDADGNPVPWETDEDGNLLPLATDEDGNLIHPSTEAPPDSEKKSGGFSIVSFIIGFLSVIILEVLVAAIMILIRRLKRKAQLKKAAAAEGGAAPDEDAEGGKKKKGIKLPIPKIKLPKIKIPKIKLPKIKIGGKKKKKDEETEE